MIPPGWIGVCASPDQETCSPSRVSLWGEKKSIFILFFFPLKNSQTVLRAVKYRETQFPGKGVPTLDSLPNTPGDLFVSVRSQFTPGNINKDISVLWVCVGGWLVFFIYFFLFFNFFIFFEKGLSHFKSNFGGLIISFIKKL